MEIAEIKTAVKSLTEFLLCQNILAKFDQALAAHLSPLSCQIDSIQKRLDDGWVGTDRDRLDRLETLFVCGPTHAPSVDEVLQQMLSQKQKIPDEPDQEVSPKEPSDATNCIGHALDANHKSADENEQNFLFNLFEVTVDAHTQTIAPDCISPLKLDASTNWEPDVLPEFEETLAALVKILDQSLGFENLPIGRDKLEAKARHLLHSGETKESVRDLCKLHYKKLDDTRCGDTIILLCGPRWIMDGSGSSWISDGNHVKVTQLHANNCISARCLSTGKYGTIQLIDYLFDIDFT